MRPRVFKFKYDGREVQAADNGDTTYYGGSYSLDGVEHGVSGNDRGDNYADEVAEEIERVVTKSCPSVADFGEFVGDSSPAFDLIEAVGMLEGSLGAIEVRVGADGAVSVRHSKARAVSKRKKRGRAKTTTRTKLPPLGARSSRLYEAALGVAKAAGELSPESTAGDLGGVRAAADALERALKRAGAGPRRRR